MLKSSLSGYKRYLPLSSNNYIICFDGKILDSEENEIPSKINDDGDVVVNITWLWGHKEYKVGVLVAHAFKPLKMPFEYWSYLDVLYVNNIKTDFNPSNIIWKFPVGGLETKEMPGYYFIPGFSRYVINISGSVVNFYSKCALSGVKHILNYTYFSLAPDVKEAKRITIGLHRLLAFVFLDYSGDVDILQVNHKDGKSYNNQLDNLEWVTKKQNVTHTFATGLRKDNKFVIVTNINTGEETTYYSAHECERILGLGRSVVHWRIKQNKVFFPGLRFRYKDESKLKKKEPIPVILFEKNTGNTIYFDSMLQCSKHVGVSKKFIQSRFKSMQSFEYKNYLISKKD